ncbi:kinase-like domain-containing protein [Phaeosphaeriaceae sp. PMI808]|nr:kinase-like domain-containing protein [Phaeosphaeriaceae sp. PMI808]
MTNADYESILTRAADLNKVWRKDYQTVCAEYFDNGVLGEGADGTVRRLMCKEDGRLIAVKTPKPREDTAIRYDVAIMSEFINLLHMEDHPNIAGMIGFCNDFPPRGPAIFLPFCDLYDVSKYRKIWCSQESAAGRPPVVHEATILTLFRDVSLGLDYLHNSCEIRYIHGDLKPENILVSTPPNYRGKGMPLCPIFQIADFARSTPYPMPQDRPSTNWRGTFAFSPPHVERVPPIRPSADIWSLGMSIQVFALDIYPFQSRRAFLNDRIARNLRVPATKEEWKLAYWFSRIPTIYRPLNVSAESLQQDWDTTKLLPNHTPYSGKLNHWYKELSVEDPAARITSEQLRKFVVPMIDMELLIEHKHDTKARENDNILQVIGESAFFELVQQRQREHCRN